MQSPAAIDAGFTAAIEEARRFIGATAPNPPVGAAALDSQGQILDVAAHSRAGTEHAEAKLLRQLREKGILEKARTLIVTLEPCNHTGRTPPCTEAILANPQISEILVGATDPNPKVPGAGIARLRRMGRSVSVLAPDSRLALDCHRLIAPFARWATQGLPWVVVKTAHRFQDETERAYFCREPSTLFSDPERLLASMTPDPGRKTFTSEPSLHDAHLLRKQSDALLTGSGTVIRDNPSFTVRLVPDHPEKHRELLILDRSSRVPDEWLASARSRGLLPVRIQSGELRAVLQDLASRGAHQVLVEAGPRVSRWVLNSGLWSEAFHFLTVPGQKDLKIQRNAP